MVCFQSKYRQGTGYFFELGNKPALFLVQGNDRASIGGIAAEASARAPPEYQAALSAHCEASLRKRLGASPVQRLKAREKFPGSEKPSR